MEIIDWSEYDIPSIMDHPTVVVPRFQAQLPGDLKWQYTKKVERMLLTLVSNKMGWTNIQLTEGFNSLYDATVDTKHGPLKIEIKCTDREDIFVETGDRRRGNTGLRVSQADVYLIMSRELRTSKVTGELGYLGKVRLCFVNDLQRAYMDMMEAGKQVELPEYLGYGSIGIYFTSFQLPHIWIGDVKGQARGELTSYRLHKWENVYSDQTRSQREFDVRMQEHLQFLKELELDQNEI